jgi:hypothetical protein
MARTTKAKKKPTPRRKPKARPLVAGAAAAAATVAAMDLPPLEHRALVLRSCDSQMGSHGGFRWPEKGIVTAPDWDPRAVCGYGLHGLLWGEGDVGLLGDVTPGARRWLVVAVDARELVDIDRKVKFPRGWVLEVFNDPRTAMLEIDKQAPKERAGRSGNFGTATAGDRGTATAGDRGTATAGYGGTATAGDRGTATAGEEGTATAGYGGTATAGEEGTIVLFYWDDKAARLRRKVGEVGEGGLKPNTKYRLNDARAFEVVEPAP